VSGGAGWQVSGRVCGLYGGDARRYAVHRVRLRYTRRMRRMPRTRKRGGDTYLTGPTRSKVNSRGDDQSAGQSVFKEIRGIVGEGVRLGVEQAAWGAGAREAR
jgi:hypothetical protein